jgi:tRNA A37 threonylcarbamoyladenosine dehydratase
LSSLNRHAVAVREDVGYPKATVLANYFRRFAPHCQVDARVQLFQASDAESLMSGSPDYVIDAIDDADTKVGGNKCGVVVVTLGE